MKKIITSEKCKNTHKTEYLIKTYKDYDGKFGAYILETWEREHIPANFENEKSALIYAESFLKKIIKK